MWQKHTASLRVCHRYYTITYTDVHVYDIYVSNSFFFSLSSVVSSSIGWDVMNVWVNWFGGVYKRRTDGWQASHLPEIPRKAYT